MERVLSFLSVHDWFVLIHQVQRRDQCSGCESWTRLLVHSSSEWKILLFVLPIGGSQSVLGQEKSQATTRVSDPYSLVPWRAKLIQWIVHWIDLGLLLLQGASSYSDKFAWWLLSKEISQTSYLTCFVWFCTVLHLLYSSSYLRFQICFWMRISRRVVLLPICIFISEFWIGCFRVGIYMLDCPRTPTSHLAIYFV